MDVEDFDICLLPILHPFVTETPWAFQSLRSHITPQLAQSVWAALL